MSKNDKEPGEARSKEPLWKRAVVRAIGNESSPGEPLTNRLLKRLPGGEFAQAQLDRIEQRVMHELKARLDRLETPEASVAVMAFSVETPPPTPEQKQRAAGEMMRRLLEASTEQNKVQAQAAYYAMIVGNLLPDEARILSALSDGSAFPLINVQSTSMIGLSSAIVLENACSVGKNAGVQWPEMTRGYVQRLLAAGLATVGPEDEVLASKYEMLETDDDIRRAVDQIRAAGQRAQIKRRSLRISELGRNLWEACRISED